MYIDDFVKMFVKVYVNIVVSERIFVASERTFVREKEYL